MPKGKKNKFKDTWVNDCDVIVNISAWVIEIVKEIELAVDEVRVMVIVLEEGSIEHVAKRRNKNKRN